MNMFVIMALMLGLSGAWIGWFLYRPLRSNQIDLEQSNIALGKQKQAELNQDLTQNLISAGVFEEAKAEVVQTLAVELNQTPANQSKNPANSSKKSLKASLKISHWTLGFVLFVLPIFSVILYQTLSTHSDIRPPQVSAQPLDLAQSKTKLEQHLANNPEDFGGWKMLGLVAFELNQIPDALRAYERAYQLNPKHVSLLVEYAATVATAQNNQFGGRPAALIAAALKINPNAPDALYLAGLIAASNQQFALAQKTWQHAATLLPQGSADLRALEAALAELARLMTQPEPNFVESNSVEQKSANAHSNSAIVKHFVRVQISVSEAILKTRSEDFLMVYVKSATGRPMPIAIQKIKLKDLSGAIILNDANSVMPTRTLSQAGQIVAVVRLSKTGSAMRQLDDLEAVSAVLNAPDNPTIQLHLE